MRAVLASVLVLFGFVILAGCGGKTAVTPTAPPTEAPKSAIGVSGGPKIPDAPK